MLISRKTLEYLAGLARIKIGEKKEEKLLKDLGEILAYFEELKALDTSNIEPMTGGADSNNVFREDEKSNEEFPPMADQPRAEVMRNEKLIDAFPEKENNFLKVPAIFE